MYIPPPRYIDFERSSRLQLLTQGWSSLVRGEIDKVRTVPRVLDPLKATANAIQDSVTWSGFPRALDSWFDVENRPARKADAHLAAEVLYRTVPVVVSSPGDQDRVVDLPYQPALGIFLAPTRRGGGVSIDDAFGLAERPQDEYLEWHTVRDPGTGAVTRIDFTSEPPEYWEFLGEEDPSVAAKVYGELVSADVREEDIVFPRDVQCPRFFVESMRARYVEHVRLADQGIRRPERFTAGQYNPNNRWNTESGVVHLVQRNNTLFAEINLAANATRRFAVRPDLETQVDRFTLTAAGGFGGVNRNSDPSIGIFVNDLALDGHRVMVSNPLGLFISEVNLGGFRDPDGKPVDRDQILTTVRGKWDDEPGRARVVRFSIHPPKGANYTLDQCTFDGHRLDTGGPIARKTLIAVHGIAEPGTDDEPLADQEIMPTESDLVEHPTLRPKLFATVDWARRLQIGVPESSLDPDSTRAIMRAMSGGRGE